MTLMSVRLGCNDLEKARAFYDASLASLGYAPSQAPAEYAMLMYRQPGAATLMVGGARDGNPATYANGGTVGFAAPSAEAVDAWYAAGMANGGICEGAPGPRERAGGAYGAYMRDPDGNKLCAYHGLGMGG